MSPENKILGFEVLPAGAETLDLAELMQQADQFDFSGGKDANTGEPYFTAEARQEDCDSIYAARPDAPSGWRQIFVLIPPAIEKTDRPN